MSDIINNLFQCLKPKITDIMKITSKELAFTVFYVLIITVIFILLIVVILMILDDTHQYSWIIGLSIYFAILYISLIYVVIKNTEINILNNITIVETETTECINNASKEFEIFKITQEVAISKALCSYP